MNEMPWAAIAALLGTLLGSLISYFSNKKNLSNSHRYQISFSVGEKRKECYCRIAEYIMNRGRELGLICPNGALNLDELKILITDKIDQFELDQKDGNLTTEESWILKMEIEKDIKDFKQKDSILKELQSRITHLQLNDIGFLTIYASESIRSLYTEYEQAVSEYFDYLYGSNIVERETRRDNTIALGKTVIAKMREELGVMN